MFRILINFAVVYFIFRVLYPLAIVRLLITVFIRKVLKSVPEEDPEKDSKNTGQIMTSQGRKSR